MSHIKFTRTCVVRLEQSDEAYIGFTDPIGNAVVVCAIAPAMCLRDV